MAISRSKFPAHALSPALRVHDPRWPEGPKPGTIVWGEADGRTSSSLHFQVPKRDPELRVTVGRDHQPAILGLFPYGKRKHAEATVVNPVNMGITSRLTDLYAAVAALNMDAADREVRLRPADYIPKPGELAIRMFGEQKYHVYPAAASDPTAQALLTAAQDAWFGTAVGDGAR